MDLKKGIFISFLLCSLLIFSSAGVFAVAASSSSCGDVSTNLTLTENITYTTSSTTPCFLINTSNIVLDGAGFAVQSNGTGKLIDILSSVENITLKNLVLKNYSRGINFSSDGHHIDNSTFISLISANESNTFTLSAAFASNITISNNTFTLATDPTGGITMTGIGTGFGQGFRVLNNVINVSTAAYPNGAFFLSAVENNTIRGNTFYLNQETNAIKMNPIPMGATNANTLIADNVISLTGIGGACILIDGMTNVTVTNNTCTTNANVGDPYFLNTGMSAGGVAPYIAAFNNTVNFSLSGGGGINGAYYAAFGAHINVTGGSVDAATGAYSFYLDSGNISLFNASFTARSGITSIESLSAGSDAVSIYEFVTVNATISGSATSGANVTIYNSTGSSANSSLTASSGLVTIAVLGRYFDGLSGLQDYGPHVVNVTTGGYGINSTTVNLTSVYSTQVDAVLTPGCGTLTSNYTLTTDLNATGNCYTVGANNIVIDGGGYTVTGNGAGAGINFSTYDNVTVKNIVLSNFSYGLHAPDGTGNVVANSTLSTQTSNQLYLLNGNLTLQNVTHTRSNVSFVSGGAGEVTVQWYLSAYVSSSSGATSSASVTFKNVSSTTVGTGTTSSSGIGGPILATEAVRNRTTTTYHTPHTISVTASGFSDGSGTANLTTTNSTQVSITLTSTATSSSSSSSGSSSGGGGGGASTGRAVTGQFSRKFFGVVKTGQTEEVDLTGKELGITKIALEVSKDTYGAWMHVFKKEAKELPNTVPQLDVKVNTYVDIQKSNVFEKTGVLTSSKISFEVTDDWLKENGLNSQQVVLYRFVDGEWTALPTVIDSQANGKVQYTATTPGFSYFAIAQKQGTVAAAQPDLGQEEVEQQEATQEPVQEEQTPEQEEQPQAQSGSNVFLGLGLLLVLILLVAGYLLFKRK